MKPQPDQEAPVPFQRVFVATDFSRGGTLALRRAVRLPMAQGASLTIVHVLPPDLPDKFHEQVQTDAQRRLDEAVVQTRRRLRRAAASHVTVHAQLLAGSDFVEIIRSARAAKAELIVIGRHGDRTLRKALIGSTAERVMRKADLPVLVVNREARRAYERPLIAADLEDTSTEIVALALRAVAPEVGTIAVVHAYHLPFENRLGAGSSETALEFRRHYEEEAERKMGKLLDAFRTAPVLFQPLLGKGDPRSVVLCEAERMRADLIVVGTHGRTGVTRMLVGSVAEWVVRHSRSDVLIARPVRVSFEMP